MAGASALAGNEATLNPVGENEATVACSGELDRTLGITQIGIDGGSDLRSICPHGTLELVSLSAAVGQQTALYLEFRQLAFDQAIYHLELRDSEQRPVEWVLATPRAGEMESSDSASIELMITPPVEMISTVQAVTIGVSIHDGERSWSRDLLLQIAVDDEQPLFRDQFEIDPVIGQFSQRKASRQIHLIAARPAGGQ